MALSISIAVFVSVFLMAFLAGYYIYTRSSKGREAPAEGISETRVAQRKETVFKPTKEELRIFVGTNADYYLTQWGLMEETGRMRSWNFPAALFTFFWMVHRKMYLYALIVLPIEITMIASLSPTILFFGLYIAMIALGLYGNFLYYVHAVKKIAALESVSLPKTPLLDIVRYYWEKRKAALTELRPESAAEPDLAGRGGTSWIVPAYFTLRFALILAPLIAIDSLLLMSFLMVFSIWLVGIEHPWLILVIYLISLLLLASIAHLLLQALLRATYFLVKKTPYHDFANTVAFGVVLIVLSLPLIILLYFIIMFSPGSIGFAL